MDDDDDRSPHDPLLDPDGEPAYCKPLDIARILDGIDPDDPEHDGRDGTELADQDDAGSALDQDAAGDVFELGDDAEEQDEADGEAGQPRTGTVWEVVIASRDDAGQWTTMGEVVNDARYAAMSLVHDFAEVRNRRQFGQKFGWSRNPAKAWLAVRAGESGALRLYEPAAVAAFAD